MVWPKLSDVIGVADIAIRILEFFDVYEVPKRGVLRNVSRTFSRATDHDYILRNTNVFEHVASNPSLVRHPIQALSTLSIFIGAGTFLRYWIELTQMTRTAVFTTVSTQTTKGRLFLAPTWLSDVEILRWPSHCSRRDATSVAPGVRKRWGFYSSAKGSTTSPGKARTSWKKLDFIKATTKLPMGTCFPVPIGPLQITAPKSYLNPQRSSTNVSSCVLNNKMLSFPCCTVPFNAVTDAVMIQGSDVHWSVQPLRGLSQW